MRLAARVVAALVVLVLLLTLLLGLPGLLGVSLTSSPVWNLDWFVTARQWFEASTPGLGRLMGSAIMNLVIAVAFVLFSAVGIAAIFGLVWLARKRIWSAIVSDVVLMAAGVWILVSLVYAAVASGGFRSNLLGWLLILGIFGVINRIGQWRWNHWDEQERWALRSAIAGPSKRRRAGRRLDAAIYGVLAVAALAAAIAIAIRPLLIDLANGMLIAAAVSLVIAVLAGLAQDEVNGTETMEGMDGPTPVSELASAK
jgi:hypothetical protein